MPNTKLIWGNLAVKDLERTTRFYTALGFQQKDKYSSEDARAFVFGENGFIICFFDKSKLSTDLDWGTADFEDGTETIFSLSAASKEEVDEWAKAAKEAGGKVFRKPGEDKDGHYVCGFSDPDGHKFNLLLMPE